MSEPITRHVSKALMDPNTSPESIAALFGSPAVVRILLKSLPPASQCLLIRMMLIPDASRWEPFLMWFSGPNNQARTQIVKNAISACRVLRIIKINQPSSAISVPSSQPSTAAAAARGKNSAGSQISGSQIGSKQTGGSPANIRYEVHPQFRNTFLRLTTDKRLLVLPQFRWLRLPAADQLKLLTGPDAPTIESYSRQKWGGMLLWAFKQTASQSPVLRFFPITQVTPPGELLRSVLGSLGLATEMSPVPRDSDSSDVRWFLSDLSTQMDDLLTCTLKYCISNASGSENPLVSLIVLIAQIAVNRIGEPMLLEEDAPPHIHNFITVLHDMGMIYSASVSLSGHTYMAIFPCPLARLLSLDANKNNPEMWILSQMYGADTFQHTATSLAATSNACLALPRQRYGPLALPNTNEYNDPPPDKVLEFAWTTPSDPLKKWNVGNRVQPTAEKRKGIIVESNFRVFCYHPDALQACVIASVCELKMITPILIVAMLTRESVTKRLLEGLKAEQIIKFLSSHAHSLVIAKLISTEQTQHDSTQFTSRSLNTTALPENVQNQILLWEDQLSAITQVRAALFEITDASELAIFPHMCYRAKASGFLLCHTPYPSTSPQELQRWQEEAVVKLKTVGTNAFQTKFGADKNWYPSAPIVVVKAEYKDEFLRVIKVLKTAKKTA